MHRSKTQPVVLTTGRGLVQWSPHGQELFFERGATPERADFWVVDVKSRSERQLTNLFGRPGRLFRFATDGTYLYFLWNEELGDIWVMDVVTDKSE